MCKSKVINSIESGENDSCSPNENVSSNVDDYNNTEFVMGVIKECSTSNKD